jgi:hypothetical protein
LALSPARYNFGRENSNVICNIVPPFPALEQVDELLAAGAVGIVGWYAKLFLNPL